MLFGSETNLDTKPPPTLSLSPLQEETAMRFTIATDEFKALLNKLHSIVAQKSTIPILSNILIEAINGELILTATDLTVGVRCFSSAKIEEEGATTLPARRLSQLVKELTAPHIEVVTNEQEVTELIVNSSHFKLHGMSRKEFPSLPDISSAQKFTLSQRELKEVLFHTAFAVSKEDNRYVLTGVFMQIEKGIATFIGTDGKRLAKTKLPVPVDPEHKGSYIIPLKAVDEIQKSLQDSNDEATFYLMADKIAVEANGSILISKLLTGDYPDVTRVIPQTTEKKVVLHRDELITLLRQVSLFTSDVDHSVRFSFQSGELSLQANSIDIGEGQVSMPVNYQGEPLDIAFNPSYFLDILRHSKEEQVNIELIDSFNPGIITQHTSTESTEASPLFVLMPLRLSN